MTNEIMKKTIKVLIKVPGYIVAVILLIPAIPWLFVTASLQNDEEIK